MKPIQLQNRILGSRSLQYMIFWAVSFVFLLNYFTKGTDIGRIDLIYTGLFHISLVAAVSGNSFLLIPRYLARRRYTLYFSGLALLLGFSVWLNIFTFQYLSDWLFPGYYFISYLEWWEILEFMLVYVGLTSLLEFSKSWFRELEMEKKMETLQKEKVETELKALKAQINPHFLFNSLNHIYALAVRQSPATAEATLQLADLLRYVIRNVNREKVPLQDEIEYLQKFTELHKNRLHHPERVTFAVEGEPGDKDLPPLLLGVFVENCFKHGSTGLENERIDICLKIEETRIKLAARNNIKAADDLPERSGGTGLVNVKRRLDLLYEDRYTLDIEQGRELFEVKLQLELE